MSEQQSSARGKPLSLATASTVIAKLTLRRLLSSRSVIVVALFIFAALVPLFVGAWSDSHPDSAWRHYFGLSATVQLLVASLLMAPAIAEEFSDKTYSYLWARPLPRSAVLLGKLIAGTLIAGALFATATLLASTQVPGLSASAIPRSILALCLGVVVVGCMSASIGILLPKFPLAISISYFLIIDIAMGAMPFAVANLSVHRNVRVIAGTYQGEASSVDSVLSLVGLALVPLLIGLWRLGRKEITSVGS